VTDKGARTWCAAFWSPLAKTTRRLTIGDAASMPLAKARAEARGIMHAVEAEGRDPYAERLTAAAREREERRRKADERRREAEERARRSVTFGTLCRAYIEHRRTVPSGRFKRTARPNTLNVWEGMLSNHILPNVGDMAPEDITAEDFVRVLEAAVKRGGPSMGPRVRELLCAAWRWIESRPRILGVKLPPVSPLAGLPKIGDAQTERDRTLSPAEIWRFWRAAETVGPGGDALRFSLLTASRVREATDLPWSELDLGAAVWRLPAARNKGGRDRVIPLSVQAVALLRRAQAVSAGPLVFDGASRLPDTMNRIRAEMGGEPWQARDLRRTAATLCARLGADPFVVSLVLGHARPDERMPAVTGTYCAGTTRIRSARHSRGSGPGSRTRWAGRQSPVTW
jgi:integrase